MRASNDGEYKGSAMSVASNVATADTHKMWKGDAAASAVKVKEHHSCTAAVLRKEEEARSIKVQISSQNVRMRLSEREAKERAVSV